MITISLRFSARFDFHRSLESSLCSFQTATGNRAASYSLVPLPTLWYSNTMDASVGQIRIILFLFRFLFQHLEEQWQIVGQHQAER